MSSEEIKQEDDEDDSLSKAPPNYPCPFCAVTFHNKTTITRHVARCGAEAEEGQQQQHTSTRPDMKPFVGRTSTVIVVDISDDEDEESASGGNVVKKEPVTVSYTDDECVVIEEVDTAVVEIEEELPSYQKQSETHDLTSDEEVSQPLLHTIDKSLCNSSPSPSQSQTRKKRRDYLPVVEVVPKKISRKDFFAKLTDTSTPKHPKRTPEDIVNRKLNMSYPSLEQGRATTNVAPSPNDRSKGSVRDVVYQVLSEMKIESLKNFQLQTIEKVLDGESVILTNKCGSGKTLSFTIPAMVKSIREKKFTLVIEPAVTLIQEQVESLCSKGVDAIALGNPAGRMQRMNYQRLLAQDPLPAMVYCTPEYLFHRGDLRYEIQTIRKSSLGLIVVDECHKAVDRRTGFRNVYAPLNKLFDNYDVPVIACSATLPGRWLFKIKNDFFRGNATCLLNPIKRDHVKISFEQYTKNKDKSSSGYTWEMMIQRIVQLVSDHTTICFVDYQIDAEAIAPALCNEGLGARFLVGGKMHAEEKKIASESFKDGLDQILVATETYECGMHNEKCSLVLRIGTTRNLAVLVQELGRTGRSDDQGQLVYFWNEFLDDQRLANWVKDQTGDRTKNKVNKDDPEIVNIINDYRDSWKFIYSQFVGMCYHQALSTFYDDPADIQSEIEFIQVLNCKCEICQHGQNITTVDISEKLHTVLYALHTLEKEDDKITMRRFWQFAMQSSAQWLADKPSVISLAMFGFARDWKDVTEEGFKNLFRIGVCVGAIHLDFDFIFLDKGVARCFRRLLLTELGKSMINNQERGKAFLVPDPFCLNKKVDGTQKKSRKKSGSSHFGWPQIKEVLSKPHDWLTITDPHEFRALGYGIEKFPFLYFVENWKRLKDASHRDFMRDDLQLTKGSGRSTNNATYTVKMSNKDIEVTVKLNKCTGCKKCPVDGCNMAFNNYARHNSCPQHRHEYTHVVEVGRDCPVSFVYIYPVDDADYRQWLGCVTKESGHNHPSPVDWKLKSKTKQDLKMAKASNPLGKPKDFQKGLDFHYEPMLTDPAASHCGRFNREVSKSATTTATSRRFATMEIVSHFHEIVDEVDKKTNPEQADDKIKSELDDMMESYATQDHCIMIGDRMYGFFAAKWQSSILSSANHLFLDICYVKNEELPGLFNVVAPCKELKRYVPVYRVFLNRQDSTAIAYVIKTIFKEVQSRHPNFDNGGNLEQIMVDFSDAEENGLREALGDEMVDKILQGCKFHFMQSVNKVANLVTETESKRKVFVQIARRIPDLSDQAEVYKSFDVLGGMAPASEIIFSSDELNKCAALVNNNTWTGASTWVDWWLRPRHLAKLSMAFSGISEENWIATQSTNNPVESINRTSKPSTLCPIKDSLRHVYYEDRRFAFMLIAVRGGKSITYRQSGSKKPRKRKLNGMGNPQNPPNKKAKLKKVPRGEKAVNHRVEVEYDLETGTEWLRGRIIMYSKTRGYLVSFDGLGPEHNQWEKKITDPDFKFID